MRSYQFIKDFNVKTKPAYNFGSTSSLRVVRIFKEVSFVKIKRVYFKRRSLPLASVAVVRVGVS